MVSDDWMVDDGMMGDAWWVMMMKCHWSWWWWWMMASDGRWLTENEWWMSGLRWWMIGARRFMMAPWHFVFVAEGLRCWLQCAARGFSSAGQPRGVPFGTLSGSGMCARWRTKQVVWVYEQPGSSILWSHPRRVPAFLQRFPNMDMDGCLWGPLAEGHSALVISPKSSQIVPQLALLWLVGCNGEQNNHCHWWSRNGWWWLMNWWIMNEHSYTQQTMMNIGKWWLQNG